MVALCKLCNSDNTIKYGTYTDKDGEVTQYYYCLECKRKFKGDDALFHSKVPASNVSSALSMYYSGMSLNDIRQYLRQERGYTPSSSSVYEWIDKYSDKAVKYYDQLQPKVGDIWIADETTIEIDGKNVWLWDIIDADTRFLLATKMSYTRKIPDAQTLFELAKKKAGKSPKVIVTDGLPAYLEAADNVFGKGTYHKRSSPFVDKEDSTNIIERWHSTLKERTKILRGLKDTESALAFIDGFLVFYNFIRPHESLGDRTPAEEAGIDYAVKNWADVIRIGEIKREEIPHSIAYEPMRLEVTGNPDASRPGRKRGVTYKEMRQKQAAIKRAKAKKQKMKEQQSQPIVMMTLPRRKKRG